MIAAIGIIAEERIRRAMEQGGFEGLAGYAAFDTPASFVLRGDANQDFSIPEPTSMALLGLGFAALGIRRRTA